MPTVTHKGNIVNLKGNLPKPGEKAPDFTFVGTDLSEQTLYGLGDKIKVILAVPSLDTGVCAMETRKFNEHLASRDNIVGLVVSKDLPFAMKRFCETDGIKNIVSASDFRYNEFGTKFNSDMVDGKLKGLSSRAIFILDKNNTIKYVELVPEITQEPDYANALKAIESI